MPKAAIVVSKHFVKVPVWNGHSPAAAILDRIVHNAHRIDLDGPSMRKLEAINPETIDHDQGK